MAPIPVEPKLTRSELRSWRLHSRLSTYLNESSLPKWRPIMEDNIRQLKSQVRGQPHLRNLDTWQQLVECGDILGIHRALTGLDRSAIEMREVTPMSGLLSEEDRLDELKQLGQWPPAWFGLIHAGPNYAALTEAILAAEFGKEER